MDKEGLVDSDIDAGKRLISVVESSGLPVSAAMWLKRADDRDYKFYVVTPDVEKHGPIAVYRFIDTAITSSGSQISPGSVVVANTTNHFANTVASGVGARM
jgi:hypothetical protein